MSSRYTDTVIKAQIRNGATICSRLFDFLWAFLLMLGFQLPLAAAAQTVMLQGGGSCNLHNGIPSHITDVHWSGACVRGYAEGPGVIRQKVSPNGRPALYSNASGTMMDGKRNGIWINFTGPTPENLESLNAIIWRAGELVFTYGTSARSEVNLQALENGLRRDFSNGKPGYGPVSSWGPSLLPDQAVGEVMAWLNDQAWPLSNLSRRPLTATAGGSVENTSSPQRVAKSQADQQASEELPSERERARARQQRIAARAESEREELRRLQENMQSSTQSARQARDAREGRAPAAAQTSSTGPGNPNETRRIELEVRGATKTHKMTCYASRCQQGFAEAIRLTKSSMEQTCKNNQMPGLCDSDRADEQMVQQCQSLCQSRFICREKRLDSGECQSAYFK